MNKQSLSTSILLLASAAFVWAEPARQPILEAPAAQAHASANETASKPVVLPNGTPEVLRGIHAQSLRGHLSFIASDLLQGRDTPSPGLTMAAEYIAAQFRRAGLSEIPDGGYFQVAKINRDGRKGVARNVVGILPGSDPVLRNTFVVLSAHYDHLGVTEENGQHLVNPGANDDGSGTVSVVEIAAALARSHIALKRSIMFIAFYGEEEGFWGSRYFIEHPIVPLNSIVAQINLEQVGRTDDLDGQHIASVGVTGFDYSNIPKVLQAAGAVTGISVHGDHRKPDDYYERSDNLPFAKAGIPSHTLGAAFEFPDYHKPGDTWDKIDYFNMAAIDRMVAATLVLLADSPNVPQWNPQDKETAHYRDANNSAANSERR